MLANIPAGARVVVEPVVPNVWLTDGDSAVARWRKFPALGMVIDPQTGGPVSARQTVILENYEQTLSPGLVGYYERHGYCWVVSGYTQSGRASVNPPPHPNAPAYYRELARRSSVVYHISPYSSASSAVKFSFDWTFDYYPLAYQRPGPEMTIYRLHGGQCTATAETAVAGEGGRQPAHEVLNGA
jgi:hypothetical protein